MQWGIIISLEYNRKKLESCSSSQTKHFSNIQCWHKKMPISAWKILTEAFNVAHKYRSSLMNGDEVFKENIDKWAVVMKQTTWMRKGLEMLTCRKPWSNSAVYSLETYKQNPKTKPNQQKNHNQAISKVKQTKHKRAIRTILWHIKE